MDPEFKKRLDDFTTKNIGLKIALRLKKHSRKYRRRYA